MINLDVLDIRTLQKESAIAVVVLGGDNHNLSKYNKLSHHNSHSWYKAVIKEYIDIYGNFPSQAGPGINVTLIF